MEQTNQVTKNSTLKDILVAFRKNWILILLVIVLSSIAGIFYAKFQKPVYTARHQAFYSTRNIIVDDPNSAEHINAARAFRATVADFSNEQYVVNRADYLYSLYLTEKKTNDKLTAEEFLDNLDNTIYKHYDFDEVAELKGQYIDVFFNKDVVEDKITQTRTYVFRGKLVKYFNDKIAVLSSEGVEQYISFKDFLYAVHTDAYQSEYAFKDLALVPNGHDVKFITLPNTGLPSEISGKFVVSEDLMSYSIASSNGGTIPITKENFKKIILETPSYFSAGSIGVEYDDGKEDTDESFIFTFKYTADAPSIAREKVQFVIKSANIEANLYLFDGVEPIQAKFKYFKNVNVTIDGDAGYLSVASSISKMKTVVIFFVIGFIASLVIAYLKEMLDTTIKKKEDLEEITDSKLLTVIPVEEDK